MQKKVVNAAEIYADKIAEMADDRTFTIHPRKGSYMVIDKKKGHLSKTSMAKAPYTISPFQDEEIGSSLPKAIKTIAGNLHSHSKGTGVIHTIDNNILLGPEAIETPDRESRSNQFFCYKSYKLLKIPVTVHPSCLFNTKPWTLEPLYCACRGSLIASKDGRWISF